MRFRPEAGPALVVLALIAAWPFWHAESRDGALRADREEEVPGIAPASEQYSAQSKDAAPSGAAAAKDETDCAECRAFERLVRRLRAREEGAARRFESASNSLSVEPAKSELDPEMRRQLELALRHAQDDKRGAAAFRAATLEALEACRNGPGCGEVALSDYWDGGCPPEHPELAREGRKVAALSRVLARKAAACSAASCPDINCDEHARTVQLLLAAERGLSALEAAGEEPGSGAQGDRDPKPEDDGRAGVEALVRESEAWRGKIAALFLGGPEPAAQIEAAAEEARSLASRLGEAQNAQSSEGRGGNSFADPDWRIRVLSVRLDRMAAALSALAKAVDTASPDRDALLFRVRRQAAGAFRDLLITQARINAARDMVSARAAEPALLARCDRQRRRQIATTRGRLRSLRAALNRCSARAACAIKTARPEPGPDGQELGAVPAQRLRLDRALSDLKETSRALQVEPQDPVVIEAGRRRYQSGESVSVRIDLRSTACMADTGAWVGLFPEDAPPLSSGEVADAVIRRLNLRGRPWEEVMFEAPGRPGRYEIRTFASQLRSGGMTGSTKFEVVPREEGCRGFTGTWDTNFGRLQVTVREGEARGSYKRNGAYRAGFLTGKVKGRVLFGQWKSDLGGGGTRLVLSKDGKSFKGTWSHFRDEFAGTGIWTGTCAGTAASQSGEDTE